MPVKKSSRPKARQSRKTDPALKRPKATQPAISGAAASKFGTGVVVLVLAGVVTIAMLLGVRESSAPVSANAQPPAVAEVDVPVDPVAPPVRTEPAARSAAVVRTSPPRTSETSLEKGSAKDATPPETRTSTAAPGTAEPPPASAALYSGAVTIAGCLERREDGFRLKNTSGDAPKARSWKSGFLRKQSAPIGIAGAADGIVLPAYVGQRVSVTGALIDREMHVHSLRRTAGSCN